MTTPWKLPHAHPAIPGGGKVLTPADREFHHYSHPGVWGSLADESMHNPFRDFDFEDNATLDRHGWDQAEDIHPGYVKDFHEAYAAHLAKAHPALSVPTHVLPQILKEGRLKSQFETTPSKGSTTLHDTDERENVEQHLFGYPTDHPAHARPIYGYLSSQPFTDDSTRGYGGTSLVLHKPAIWHRTTFTGADSLERLHRVSAAPVNDYGHDPHAWRHAVPIEHIGFDADDPHSMYGSARNRRMTEDSPAGHARAFWRGADRTGDFPYPEAQYHGGVHTHDIRFAIVRSPDTGGDPNAMSASSKEATRALTAAGIPWVHTVGYRKPRTSDHAFMNDEKHRPLPPEMPVSRHRSANLLTDLAGPIFEHQVRYQRPGGGGWLITHTAKHDGQTMARAADPEWGLSGSRPLGSYLARGYWEPADGIDSRDVLAVCRNARRKRETS